MCYYPWQKDILSLKFHYLIDEPSACLDSEQRISVCQILKKFAAIHQVSIFVVEHDLMMANYLADRTIVFSGEPGIKTECSSPMSFTIGFNQFLKFLNVTVRMDRKFKRPRINKFNSKKDKEQKQNGRYYE